MTFQNGLILYLNIADSKKDNNLCAIFVIEFNSEFTDKIKNCIVENYNEYISEYDYYYLFNC